MPGFSWFNPSKGQLIEMTINPSAATIAAGAAAAPAAASRIQPVEQQPAVAPVLAGMAVRRDPEGGR